MENSSDITLVDHVSGYQFKPLHLVLFLMFTIPLWIVNVVGNTLVLLCVYCEKQLRRPSYYLIAALSIADIAYPLIGFIPSVYTNFMKNPWVCDPLVQFLFVVPSNVAACASFLILITLTTERYLSIAFPVYHRKTVTTQRVVTSVIWNWITSVLTCIALYPFRPSSLQRVYCAPFQFLFLVIDVVFGVIGVIVLSSLNAHLLLLIKRRLRKEPELKSSSRDDQIQIHKTKMNAKASKAVSTVVTFFILCWLPVHHFLLIEAINYRTAISPALLEVGRKLLNVIFLLNGAINPIVYARQNPKFRSAFRKVLGRPENQIVDLPEARTNKTGVTSC